jgi:hypothetical protein
VDGDEAAIDPSGSFLYVKQLAHDPALLVRVPAGGGSAETLPLPASLRLNPGLISPNAVNAQGAVVIETSSADSFFFSAAIYDPVRRSATRIPVKYQGDIWSPAWSSDGRIAARGARFASSVWRYQ